MGVYPLKLFFGSLCARLYLTVVQNAHFDIHTWNNLCVKFAAIRCCFTCSCHQYVEEILEHHVNCSKLGLRTVYRFRVNILFFEYSVKTSMTYCNIHRFFIWVTNMLYSMLLSWTLDVHSGIRSKDFRRLKRCGKQSTWARDSFMSPENHRDYSILPQGCLEKVLLYISVGNFWLLYNQWVWGYSIFRPIHLKHGIQVAEFTSGIENGSRQRKSLKSSGNPHSPHLHPDISWYIHIIHIYIYISL